MASAHGSKDVSSYQVAALILGVVALKSAFVLTGLPSMWVWGDEILYYTTAYDLVHPGAAGAPHPGFMNYPPLTSVLIAPVHLLGMPEMGYPLSLVILNLTQALGALAAYLMVFEIFGFKSRGLLLLLLVGPTAYMGVCLMSETLFVALYLWLLYFYVRQLKTERLAYAVAVGVLIALMILTRKTGIGLFASVVASAGLAFWWSRDMGRYRQQLRSHGLTLLVAASLVIGWRLILTYGFETNYGYLGPAGYLERGLVPAMASVETFLLLVRKFLANLGYISLSTYGVCVPLVLWCVFLKRPDTEDGEAGRRELLQRVVLHVVVFALFAAFAAALHMYVNKYKPNVRYLMYGRYMEYFSPFLLALSYGLIVRARGWRRSWPLVGWTAGLGLCVMLILPLRFFSNPNIAPNNMGVGWILGLAGDAPRWAMVVCPLVGLALVTLIVAPAFAGKQLPMRFGYLAVLSLALFNLSIAARLASDKSQTFQNKFGAYSAFLANNEPLTSNGIFVDRRSFGKKRARRNRWSARKVLADHVHRTVVRRDPLPFLGKMPVVSPRHYPGYEVLFQAEGFNIKIYGERVEENPRRDLDER